MDDQNLHAFMSVAQYEFWAGVSTETALHEFVRRLKQCLARKKNLHWVFFLDMIGAFDNVIFSAISMALQRLEMPAVLTKWIENMLMHCAIEVEVYGKKVKREMIKGNPEEGILSPFLWNCVLNSLLVELHKRNFICKPMPMIWLC